MKLRLSEWIIAAYFTYTAVFAHILTVRPAVPRVTLALNAVVIGGLLLLVYAHSLRGKRLLGVLRDWYPMPLLLLAYREMGWFAPAHHSYRLERTWVAWDKAVLNDWGVRNFIELLGPVLPSLLEISYTLVYTLPPLSLAILYAYRKDARAERLLKIVLPAVLVAYAMFPYFPSEPPRTVFPGQDFPRYDTIFRRLNWAMLGGYGIHTSVFPSAHVSGAFSSAFAMIWLLPEHKWVGRFLLAMAILIATATVYGRYHYLADATAGFALAALSALASVWAERRRKGRESAQAAG